MKAKTLCVVRRLPLETGVLAFVQGSMWSEWHSPGPETPLGIDQGAALGLWSYPPSVLDTHTLQHRSSQPEDRDDEPAATVKHTSATRPKPQKHRIKVRQRHGFWVASCSCGWSEEAVSKFSAWMVSRHHLDQTTDA